MPFLAWKSQLAESISQILSHPEIKSSDLFNDFTIPPQVEMGHLALPCFRLAKVLKNPAGKIAQELKPKISCAGVSVTTAGPYLNFKFEPTRLF